MSHVHVHAPHELTERGPQWLDARANLNARPGPRHMAQSVAVLGMAIVLLLGGTTLMLSLPVA